jgi:hypothetical protein
MPTPIRLRVEQLSLAAELNDSISAQRLLQLLPLEIRMSRWGDEYYGNSGLQVDEEPEARTEMAVGELAVWPEGSAVCIFFGPTPASHGDEPRAISNVNPIGSILDDIAPLRELGSTVRITIERRAPVSEAEHA